MPRSAAIDKPAFALDEPSPLDSIESIDDCAVQLTHTIDDICEFDDAIQALQRIEAIKTFLQQDLRDQAAQFETYELRLVLNHQSAKPSAKRKRAV